MQPKVSMVMPVFNKIDYIDMMLQSVYDQVWDNIELIMVNDGATDGTRERIAEWLPRFKARGYSVIIIDQENQGIPAAVKAGLLRISGDYVCLVDCDDKLEPDYASTMAGWLDGHPEDMWTACAHRRCLFEGGSCKVLKYLIAKRIPSPPLMMEKYLSGRFVTVAWIYMVRSCYLKACKVTEHFIADLRSTQEPGFLFPLILGGGKLKVIDRFLYSHNFYPERTSAINSSLNAIDFFNKYKDMVIKTIEKLTVDELKKEKWRVIAELRHKRSIICALEQLGDENQYLFETAAAAADLICKYFTPNPGITAEHIAENAYHELAAAVADCILGVEPVCHKPRGRVIGCGALGTMAKEHIPDIIGTILGPTDLWDELAIPGDSVCGMTVTPPDYDSLLPEDMVWIFPKEPRVNSELHHIMKIHGVINILEISDLNKILPELKYPQFYNECKFVYS